jgi:hypothetical protein
VLARRLCAVAAAIAVICGVSASSALAQAGNCPGETPANPDGSPWVWSKPQCLSPGNANGEVPQVAIADDGSALAVWRFPDSSGDTRVQAAFRRRGENFQLVGGGGFISEAGRQVGSYIRMKMNKRGDAMVVWEAKEDNGKVGVRSAYKPFDGDFGAEQIVKNSPGNPSFAFSYVDPEVGIDGAGASTVIFHRPPTASFNGHPTIDSSYSSKSRAGGAASTWGDEQFSLSPHDPSTETHPVFYTETHGSLVENEDGDRIVVLASQEDDNGAVGRQILRTSSRQAGDADWSYNGPSDTGATDEEITSTHLAYSKDGENAASAWAEGSALHASYRTNQNNINGPFNGPGPNHGAALGIDSAEDGLALWSDNHELRAAFADVPPGSFAAPVGDPVPGGGAGVERTRPSMASDDTGQHLALFQQRDLGTGDETVQAAVRPVGGTTGFSAPIRLSPADNVDLETEGDASGSPFLPKAGTGPQIAVNSGGEAVAAWAVFDGSATVVQVSLLTPRSDPAIPPPPPPPPRPAPLQPVVIDLARPIARDKAVVLIANVPAGVDSLKWDFDSKGEPDIEGKVEGGELQRTVRLRLPSSAFTARVHTTGADGINHYSRSFTSLKPSPSKETTEVQAGLAKSGAPPVFAVGKKETLTGESGACAPSTIWSGEQKMSGCFKPMEHLPDIPPLEQGAIHEVANELGLDQTKKELMDKATELTDGYVAQGQTLLNDKFPVTPSQAAQIVSIPNAKVFVSAKAELPVGGASYDPKNGFNLKLDPKKTQIPLGKLPKPPKLPSLAGLEIVGDWDVDLDKQEAKIKASVKMPPAIKKAGVQISSEVKLTATPDRVVIDSVRIGPIDVNIASLSVQKFQIQYLHDPDEWDGQGKACVIGTACLSMIPPDGGVTIKRGDLDRAGASLIFPPPGIPLFTGVNLERVGFGVGLRPTRITGNARVGVGELLKLDGRILLAFPDAEHPFVLDRKEVGNGYAPNLYGQVFHNPTFGATAEAFLKVPVIGETRLANAYVLYEYPGYAAFGGGYDARFLDLLSISGGVSAEVDFGEALFNVHGEVRACLHIIDDLCEGAVANVSRGRGGTGGAGACVQLGPLSIGGGIQWQRASDPFIWPFDGCKWSRFTAKVHGSAVHAAQAPGTYTVTVKKGEPSPAIQLDGVGGAPTIRVRGPGGQLFEAPAGKGFVRSPDNTIRILRFDGKSAKFAVVGFQNAQPGTYTVSTLPGSPAVAGIRQATNPPDAKVSGRVTGKGRFRTLSYKLRPRQGQKVTFQELQPGGEAKPIGTTARSRGRIRFRSGPGRGRRRVLAQFELSGIPAERKLVTTFKPQSPFLSKARRIRVRRSGNRLLVRWRPVSGAEHYEVAAALSGGRMKFARTRHARATVKGVPRWRSGRVTVRSVDQLRQSKVARSVHFKATGNRPSPFRPLQRCRVGARTIRCVPSPSTCVPGLLGVTGTRIGPARLGASLRTVSGTYFATARGAGMKSFCVSGTGGRFLVGARKGKIDLVATTARGHSTRKTGPGQRLTRRALRGTRKLGSGLVVGHRVGHGRVVYGVRGRRIQFLAVVSRRELSHPGSIARRLRSLR